MTLTDWLRKNTKAVVDPIAIFLYNIGISANMITLLGLFGTLIAAIFIGKGNFLIGGIIVIFMCPLDALDGAIARVSRKTTKFGGLLDSVSDRYSEILLTLSILVYFLNNKNTLGIIASFSAMSGSLLVPYVRARAEGLGVIIKQGVLTRVERSVILTLSLLFSLPLIGMMIIAILANITAVQRIIIARRLLTNEETGENND